MFVNTAIFILLPLFFHVSAVYCAVVYYSQFIRSIFFCIFAQNSFIFFFLSLHLPHVYHISIDLFAMKTKIKKICIAFFSEKQICAIEWHMKVRMKMSLGGIVSWSMLEHLLCEFCCFITILNALCSLLCMLLDILLILMSIMF